MSDRPIYLRFGIEHEMFVRRAGDAVEVVGALPPALAPEEADALADALRDIAFRIRFGRHQAAQVRMSA